jgi:hypothetical protein
MRSTTSWVVTVLLVIAGANLFWWQHYQIASYRAQLEDRQLLPSGHHYRRSGYPRDSAATPAAWTPHAASSGGLTRADLNQSDSQADDRNLILDQYRDAIAELNLPPEKASRLLDLLDDRVQAVLDAEDNARRQGYAEASAVAQRAVAMAIAQEDQRIVQLIGLVGQRTLEGQGASAPPAAPTTVVVNVMPAPASDYAAPAYAAAPPAYDAGDYAAYTTYPYIYPYPNFYTTGIGYANYGRGGRAYAARGAGPARGAAHAISVSHSAGRRR